MSQLSTMHKSWPIKNSKNTQAPAAWPIRTEQGPSQHKCAAPSRFVTPRLTRSRVDRTHQSPGDHHYSKPCNCVRCPGLTALKNFCAPPTQPWHKTTEGKVVHMVPSQEAKRQHPCQTLAGIWRTVPVKAQASGV